MNVKTYYIDAFSDKVFGGNPAAVCPLDAWPDDVLLQRIAAENNLSETAFFVPRGNQYDLRWFTPTTEIDLCGHATLAAAHVLLNVERRQANSVTFESRSGRLEVCREGNLLSLDFPSRPGKRIDVVETIAAALGRAPLEVYLARDCVAVFADEGDVLSIKPDQSLLLHCPGLGLAITAPGRKTDFVSRAFFPKVGIAEDPVTGATHCTLIPYWAERLGKSLLSAQQLSARGGELSCALDRDRVRIAGACALYLEGIIHV